MKVSIRSLYVEMELKANGMELGIRTPDGSQQLGDCYVTMVGLTWCKGRKTKPNGVPVSWSDFMEICRSKTTLKAALEAAKAVK